MAAQPQIEVVTRDRGGGYALAASRALPGAMQVADRWHLMENASQAFLAATRGPMRQIRAKLEIAAIDQELLTAAERLQYEGYLRREDVNASVLALRDAGVAIKEIVRRTGHSRGRVRRVIRGERSEVFRSRESSLDLYLPWLDVRWRAGQRGGAALWRELRGEGFRGSLRVVGEWACDWVKGGDAPALGVLGVETAGSWGRASAQRWSSTGLAGPGGSSTCSGPNTTRKTGGSGLNGRSPSGSFGAPRSVLRRIPWRCLLRCRPRQLRPGRPMSVPPHFALVRSVPLQSASRFLPPQRLATE